MNWVVTKVTNESYAVVGETVDEAEKGITDGTAVLSSRQTTITTHPQAISPGPISNAKPTAPPVIQSTTPTI